MDAFVDKLTTQLNLTEDENRAEVKEWLDEHEMEPPRSLRLRWLMKAPSFEELGLAGEVRRREKDEDEGDQLL
ncbi:Hypothetical predicted protein [Prunus dulcis]|uniref:Uncharacterized protein n=1 Tax=Prunus dulcis TaxID=3755 RepID=A0A5E4ESV3_PRUDU|nr:Hypothetical predicted protein [Prunus dulcis]